MFVSFMALVKEKGSVALLKDALHSSNGVVPVPIMMQLKEKENLVLQQAALLGPEMVPVSVSIMVLVKERDVDALLRDVVKWPDRKAYSAFAMVTVKMLVTETDERALQRDALLLQDLKPYSA